MTIETYKASCIEDRLVSVLTEVVAGWMNDDWKQRYREAIANAVRRMAADFVTLLSDVEECQGCAGRGAGYCPTCKKSRYGTCGDCGKDLSEEERGQFRCELCSQYPSVSVKPCLWCGGSEVDASGWKNGKGDSGPQCLQCGATAESVAIWNNWDWLIYRLTNAIDAAIRKDRCATYDEWKTLVEKTLSGESNETKTRTSTN